VAVTGTKVGDTTAQLRRQMGDEQGRGRIDAIPGKQTGAADIAAVANGAWCIKRLPIREQGRVECFGRGAGPEHATVVLGEDLRMAEDLAEIRLARARAFVVGHGRGDDATGRDMRGGAAEQGTRLVALPRWQQQDQRKPLLRRGGADLQAGALKGRGKRLEALFAEPVAARMTAPPMAVA